MWWFYKQRSVSRCGWDQKNLRITYQYSCRGRSKKKRWWVRPWNTKRSTSWNSFQSFRKNACWGDRSWTKQTTLNFLRTDITMPKYKRMSTIKYTLFLILLTYLFWLSGLFVLSPIFLSIDDLDTLVLCTFGSYALGSFMSGILSDMVGRKPLFIVCSGLLSVAATTSFFNIWAGLIIANMCIGPLNNLTFVFLN